MERFKSLIHNIALRFPRVIVTSKWFQILLFSVLSLLLFFFSFECSCYWISKFSILLFLFLWFSILLLPIVKFSILFFFIPFGFSILSISFLLVFNSLLLLDFRFSSIPLSQFPILLLIGFQVFNTFLLVFNSLTYRILDFQYFSFNFLQFPILFVPQLKVFLYFHFN